MALTDGLDDIDTLTQKIYQEPEYSGTAARVIAELLLRLRELAPPAGAVSPTPSRVGIAVDALIALERESGRSWGSCSMAFKPEEFAERFIAAATSLGLMPNEQAAAPNS